ncbi:MAG: GGDEF domain-containing protein [Phycisphaerae bacterium]|nr:GGDEF domain-containing protein [Phycisphaerae bacterium]
MGETGGTPRLTVKRSIRLTLFAAVLSVAAAGFALHAFIDADQREQTRTAGAAMMTEALTTQLRADVAHSPEELQLACDRLVEHAAVLGASLWDQSGARVAAAAVDDDLLPLVNSPLHAGQPDTEVDVVKMPSQSAGGGTVAYRVETDTGIHLRRERPARMALLLDMSASLPGPTGGVWLFCASLGAVGVLTFLLCSRHLWRQVVRPISLLLDTVTTAEHADQTVSAVGFQDELGTIARSLLELREELSTWRARAERSERRLDRKIAAETQRITRDLRRVQREAWRDPLTGVNNRRMLGEKLPEILAAQRGAGQDLSVVMLDLDHFKTLNDTLGHKAGDAVLAFAGELLSQCLRADDIAVRYGGDEFILILPGLSIKRALALADRIIVLFSQRAKMMVDVRPAPTISAGIASLWSNPSSDHTGLLELADRALYEAKKAGKATARVYQSDAQLPRESQSTTKSMST